MYHNGQVGPLRLVHLSFGKTYANIMDCAPTMDMVMNVMTQLIESAKGKYGGKLHCDVHQAMRKVRDKADVGHSPRWMFLPCWTCVAIFESAWNDDPEDPYMYERGSRLPVLWFQDNPPWPAACADGMTRLEADFEVEPISSGLALELREELRCLAWKGLSEKYQTE